MTSTLLMNTKKPLSITLGRQQRGALIGKTGSGKTTLAKSMIEAHNGRLVVIDPKRLFLKPDEGDMERMRIDMVVSTLAELKFYWLLGRAKRFVFRPKIEDLDDLKMYNELFRYLYLRGNVFVYTDDMAGIIPQGKTLPWLYRCYTMGREHNVSMLTAMQRPVNFPVYLFESCEKFYVFKVKFPDDIKRIQSYVPGFHESMNATRYSFVYYDDTRDMKPERLQLTETGILRRI